VICGIGTDIVKVERLEKAIGRWGEKLLNRLFSTKEREECSKKKRVYQSLAGKFAAKEAVLKALGTGLSQGVRWNNIEILENRAGQPHTIFSKKLKSKTDKLGIKNCFISISHEADYAIAQAILLKED